MMDDPRTIVLEKAIEGWRDELEVIRHTLLQDMKYDPELYKKYNKHNFDNIIYLELRSLGPD